MTAHRLINWLLALLLVALYAGVQYLDGPSDIDAAQAHQLSLQDAQHAARNTAQADQHLARARKAAGVAL